ncbi:MAG TPA: fatty-acid--CoA ligase [Mycobacterium sp.]|nr:fatty-acid--CoA ligase [Mycobacterium sp.]
MPSPLEQHSFVLSLDYRVDDVQRTWSLIKDSHSPLASLGAHHVVLYTSTREPDRVLVTVGIRHRASIEELLRSPAVFQWFDRSGVNDIPAIFAGQVLEKVSLAKSDPDPAGAGVIVGAVSTVGDVSNLMAKVHGDLDRFHDAGVRKVWLYRAVDDGQEVLTLLEIDSVANAQRWIDHPDAAAEWMSSAGMGGYPDLFVGKLAYVMDLNLETAG